MTLHESTTLFGWCFHVMVNLELETRTRSVTGGGMLGAFRVGATVETFLSDMLRRYESQMTLAYLKAVRS